MLGIVEDANELVFDPRSDVSRAAVTQQLLVVESAGFEYGVRVGA
jgi:hypothetical protein